MTTPAPITITSTLESIWADDAEPIVIAALAASGPVGAAIAAVLNAPVIGWLLKLILNSAVDRLIAAGVIDIKIGILDFLSAKAQAKWSAQVAVLRQVSAAGKTLTPEQLAAYDAALQAIGQNHPGVVNA